MKSKKLFQAKTAETSSAHDREMRKRRINVMEKKHEGTKLRRIEFG